jgi:uncharacterized protein (DUF302 family)
MAEKRSQPRKPIEMLHKVESSKRLLEVAHDLEAACQKYQFAIYDLKEEMKQKGLKFGLHCLVYEVCGPHQGRKGSEAEGEISAPLPCRVSVYRKGSRVTLAAIRPTAAVEMFHAPQLRSMAEEVEAVMFKIMDEAAA